MQIGELSELFQLRGRKALVTGASGGIGRSIALGLAGSGADVALSGRSRASLDAVAAEARELGVSATTLPADLTEPGAAAEVVAQAVGSFGGLDILVHSAGRTHVDEHDHMVVQPLVDTTAAEWSSVIDINLNAASQLCAHAHPHLRDSDNGSVIIVSSVAALVAMAGAESYAAAKAAQLSLVKSLATAWAPDGIRVNALCPGWVKTRLTEPGHTDPGFSELAVSMVPLGRWGSVDDVIGPAVFLASPAAAFVTGHALVVDGGLAAHPTLPPGLGAAESESPASVAAGAGL